MMKLHMRVLVLLGGLLLVAGARDATLTREKQPVVVGTFDSRAVAIAYVRSTAFNKYLAEQKAEIAKTLKRAKEEGDAAFVKDLDALGPAMQLRIHQQGFGTAPVDDIIARIADRLPEIAKKAGVDVIVSKWNLTYEGPAARFVDVTDQLASEFHPDERTWEAIRGIVATEPVPLDQLKEEKD